MYLLGAFADNRGWRIDTFYISKSLSEYLESSNIHKDWIRDSDHCPVSLDLNLNLTKGSKAVKVITGSKVWMPSSHEASITSFFNVKPS